MKEKIYPIVKEKATKCLYTPIMCGEEAVKRFKATMTEEEFNAKYYLDTVAESDCWWNDPSWYN